MHRYFLLPCALLVATILSIPTARAVDTPVEPLVEKVRKAIKDGVNYLKIQQKDNGNWVFRTQRAPNGGGAALATLALLTAGEPVTDKTVRRAMDYLRGIEPSETYAVSLQTMVFAMAGLPEDMKLIQRNVDWLQKGRGPLGWSYTPNAGADNSNTQYALLALHEALLAGATVDTAALKQMRDLFLATQDGNGGWGYQPQKGDAAPACATCLSPAWTWRSASRSSTLTAAPTTAASTRRIAPRPTPSNGSRAGLTRA